MRDTEGDHKIHTRYTASCQIPPEAKADVVQYRRRRMGSEGGDMVQTFDFGSIEEMDPSVGELLTS